MVKVNSYSAKGTKGAAVALPKELERTPNEHLLAQAVHVYQSRSHVGLSKAKTRGEVSGSTRKIYRQKGTGNARHGGIRAPIFVGGGKAHGPDGLKRVLTLPKNMRRAALAMAVTTKAKAGELVLVNGLDTLKKTNDAADLVAKVKKGQNYTVVSQRVTVALDQTGTATQKLFANLADVFVTEFASLNAASVALGGLIVVDASALASKKETKK